MSAFITFARASRIADHGGDWRAGFGHRRGAQHTRRLLPRTADRSEHPAFPEQPSADLARLLLPLFAAIGEALRGQKLVDNEVERGHRTWARPTDIARLLLIRRLPKTISAHTRLEQFRVLGAIRRFRSPVSLFSNPQRQCQNARRFCGVFATLPQSL